MSYINKLKGQDGRRSVYDILSLNPNNAEDWAVINDNYRAVDIDKVVIGGNTFTNYGDFQFMWEKSYVKSPVRSANGTIDNLNSYATFVTPHLIMNFAVMSIDDFRKIVRMDLERNEFVVECYDPIYNKPMTAKMYFSTLEMAKLIKISRMRFNGDEWEDFVELVGVNEYSVELVGTNADLDLLSVRYFVNAPANMTPSVTDGGENDVYNGQEIIIGGNTDIPTETFGSRKKFKNWNTKPDGSGLNYTNGFAYTINDNLDLYAQWEDATNNILTFNYGVADEIASKDNLTYPTNKTVVKGKPIGTLPPIPKVYVEASPYSSPYINGAWYKTPTKAKNSVPVNSNDQYWFDRDSAIYLLYDVKSYNLTLMIQKIDALSSLDYEYYQVNSVEKGNPIQYNAPLSLPIPTKSGYRFDGWYTNSSNFSDETKFSRGSMPPYNLMLFGRWIKE